MLEKNLGSHSSCLMDPELLQQKQQAASVKHSVPDTGPVVVGGFSPCCRPIKQMALLPSLYSLENADFNGQVSKTNE